MVRLTTVAKHFNAQLTILKNNTCYIVQVSLRSDEYVSQLYVDSEN